VLCVNVTVLQSVRLQIYFSARQVCGMRQGVGSNPATLCLQSFVYVCGAHGRPRLRGEWIRMEGNKFILFRSQLTAVLEVLRGNVKRKLVEFYWKGKAPKKAYSHSFQIQNLSKFRILCCH
jgi:hypothetical protein